MVRMPSRSKMFWESHHRKLRTMMPFITGRGRGSSPAQMQADQKQFCAKR